MPWSQEVGVLEIKLPCFTATRPGHIWIACPFAGIHSVPLHFCLVMLAVMVVFRFSAKGELVTPTGAALVRVLSSEFGRPPTFVPSAVGEK